MRTPTTPEGMTHYDRLPPVVAVLTAWTEPGVNPRWHEEAQQAVRDWMPLLARSLDRLAAREGR